MANDWKKYLAGFLVGVVLCAGLFLGAGRSKGRDSQAINRALGEQIEGTGEIAADLGATITEGEAAAGELAGTIEGAADSLDTVIATHSEAGSVTAELAEIIAGLAEEFGDGESGLSP